MREQLRTVLLPVLAATVVCSSGFIVSVDAAGNPQLTQGISYYNRGYIQKALPLLEKAVQASPNDEQAHLWYAKALMKQGGDVNFEKARKEWAKVLETSPNQFDALTGMGRVLSWRPDSQDYAIQLYKRAAQMAADNNFKQPGSYEAVRDLAELLAWKTRYTEALGYADKVAAHYKDDKKWLAVYADILAHAGLADQAVAVYETQLGVAKPDGKPDTLQKYAFALYQAGQLEKARGVFERLKGRQGAGAELGALAFELGDYEQAVALDKAYLESLGEKAVLAESKPIRLRLARGYTRLNRIPEAIETFQAVYAGGQMAFDEKLEYADYLLSLQLPPEAMPSPTLISDIYNELLTETTDRTPIYQRLARYYAADDQTFAQAVEFYERSLVDGADARFLKEYMDFLQSSRSHWDEVDAAYQKLLSLYPTNYEVHGSYAEFLSWREERRAEAMRRYLDLLVLAPEQEARWTENLEQVLTWHKPHPDLLPFYEKILVFMPESKAARLSISRAMREQPDGIVEALPMYQDLLQRYPDDPDIAHEWLGLLTADEKHREESIDVLEDMLKEDPEDINVQLAYGKLQSYEQEFPQAMDAFDFVLSKEPDNREALLGRGLTLLWSGKKREARKFLEAAREKYPQDVEIALALAEAEKVIGRYDRALEILWEIKPLLNYSFEPPVVLCDYQTPQVNLLYRNIVYDVSVLPPRDARATVEIAAKVEDAGLEFQGDVVDGFDVSKAPASTQAVLKNLSAPNSTESQFGVSEETENARPDADGFYKVNLDQLRRMELTAPSEESVASMYAHDMFQGGLGQVGSQMQGQGGYLDGGSAELLSGMGGYNRVHFDELEDSLQKLMRPKITTGFVFSMQDGDDTTTKMNIWGVQNQLSLHVTPQTEVRVGFNPIRYYLPKAYPVNPDASMGYDYSAGITMKYWDRLTLDGDIVLTHFSQSDSNNLTYRARAKYELTDHIDISVGARRSPYPNSLLSYAGFRPTQGAFAGQLLGQTRENAFFGELNTRFWGHWDWNLGYEWAFLDGSNVPDNTKNQVFTSLGYSHDLGKNHRARLGYQFLYFGYDKNATNGYFDTTNGGLIVPVVQLRPLTAASAGFVFGGYFSPSWFMMHGARLDLQGNFFDKFIEYEAGGSLGIQSFNHGSGIVDSSPTTLATAFDAQVIVNWTDWLANYGRVDFLDSGGLFQRWRFGAGFIIRPNIPALSPMFAKGR